jgi:hypothetical protein
VDNTSMPHIHTIVQALFRQPTAGVGDVLVVQLLHAALFTAKEAVVGFAMGASVGFVLGNRDVRMARPPARLPPVRRRLADRAERARFGQELKPERVPA